MSTLVNQHRAGLITTWISCCHFLVCLRSICYWLIFPNSSSSRFPSSSPSSHSFLPLDSCMCKPAPKSSAFNKVQLLSPHILGGLLHVWIPASRLPRVQGGIVDYSGLWKEMSRRVKALTPRLVVSPCFTLNCQRERRHWLESTFLHFTTQGSTFSHLVFYSPIFHFPRLLVLSRCSFHLLPSLSFCYFL